MAGLQAEIIIVRLKIAVWRPNNKMTVKIMK